MKFRYYITNLYDGVVEGTDSEEDAIGLAECEDYFVVDSQEGLWLQPSNEKMPVEER